MKQDQSDKRFHEGDICRLTEYKSITGVLIRKTRSYMTGDYWEILVSDGSLVLVKESNLEKVHSE